MACKGKPAEGKPCPAVGAVSCAGTDRAFACVAPASSSDSHPAGGAWAAIACRGPRGCASRQGADDCDDTTAAAGDRCPDGPPVDYACTSDGGEALACKGGRFGLWRACRGVEGCRVVDGRNVRCDTSFGQADDPCGQAGTYACSVDRKAMLVCDGAKLAAASSCNGPAGCSIERDSHRVDCDDSVALEGDPCDEAKRITCSADHKAELVCSGGHYARKRECRRTDCRLDGSALYCD
jgi:hypothetical protein